MLFSSGEKKSGAESDDEGTENLDMRETSHLERQTSFASSEQNPNQRQQEQTNSKQRVKKAKDLHTSLKKGEQNGQQLEEPENSQNYAEMELQEARTQFQTPQSGKKENKGQQSKKAVKLASIANAKSESKETVKSKGKPVAKSEAKSKN